MKLSQDTFPGKCPEKSLLQGLLSYHGVKEKYQPLYQKLVLNMVRSTGLEPVPIAGHAPQTCAYADSATIACHMSDNTNYYTCRTCLCQYLTFKEKRQACRKTSLPKGIKEKWRAPALCGSFRKPYPRFSYHGAYP